MYGKSKRFFYVMRSWGRSFDITNWSVFIKFVDLVFFGGIEYNDVDFEAIWLNFSLVKASQPEEKLFFSVYFSIELETFTPETLAKH